MRRFALEIALKGQSDLEMNGSAKQYTLKSLPSEFSALQLLAIMHAAFQKVDLSAELGANFSRKYDLAIKAEKHVEFAKIDLLHVKARHLPDNVTALTHLRARFFYG